MSRYSFPLTIDLTRKDWQRVMTLVASDAAIHARVESAYNDEIRSRKIAAVSKNKKRVQMNRERQKSLTGVVGVTL